MFQHHNGILDSDTAPTSEVDARFDGHDEAGFEDTVAAGRQEWVLVDLQSDAVTGFRG